MAEGGIDRTTSQTESSSLSGKTGAESAQRYNNLYGRFSRVSIGMEVFHHLAVRASQGLKALLNTGLKAILVTLSPTAAFATFTTSRHSVLCLRYVRASRTGNLHVMELKALLDTHALAASANFTYGSKCNLHVRPLQPSLTARVGIKPGFYSIDRPGRVILGKPGFYWAIVGNTE
ncbi:hypothetical protein DPMN_039474 [Dreissena polymorpha]|uniref:Uncharacterized protein n=1 Tax=Dreissena polymorpha TaxID=45954 RepID=A0A9D4CU74_DREPO|nr:hypothetical protein DPMN_039474 [Dreissena polymorpha]